ncbi:MAG: magnesium transporter CorA family protein [Planctomycetaceae bacterium]|nr:magnesium transporter CorA family protein [Planctomycetaceae bacterium]
MPHRTFRVSTDRHLETCDIKEVGHGEGPYWLVLEQRETKKVHELLESLGLPALAIEACLEPTYSVNLQAYEHSLFIGFPVSLAWNSERRSHLRLVCLPGIIITIQEKPLPTLEHMISQYQESLRFHATGNSSILYQILDHLIDDDMAQTLRTRGQLDRIEGLIDEEDFDELSPQLVLLKRRLMRLSATLEDQLYCFSALQTIESESLSVEGLYDYFRDAISHLEHASRSISRQLSRLNAIQQELQLKMQDKTNDQLKLLTMISTIFLPLTLITGIYGMNFRHMPELHWDLGYYGVLVAMGGIAGAMLWSFHRRGWFE